MTTICLHDKWHSSASFPLIFTKIAAFESRDRAESQRCAYYNLTLSAALARTTEPHRNVDEFFTKKTFILSSLFQVVASIICGMYGSEQLKYFSQEK